MPVPINPRESRRGCSLLCCILSLRVAVCSRSIGPGLVPAPLGGLFGQSPIQSVWRTSPVGVDGHLRHKRMPGAQQRRKDSAPAKVIQKVCDFPVGVDSYLRHKRMPGPNSAERILRLRKRRLPIKTLSYCTGLAPNSRPALRYRGVVMYNTGWGRMQWEGGMRIPT